MLRASKPPRQQCRLFWTHFARLTPFRTRFWTLWLRSGLSEFNIYVISSELVFFVPFAQSCVCIVYYVRTWILAFDAELLSGGKTFFITNGQEHCFLAPAKLPRSVILNNLSINSSRLIKNRWNCTCSCGIHQKMAPHCQNLFTVQAVHAIQFFKRK